MINIINKRTLVIISLLFVGICFIAHADEVNAASKKNKKFGIPHIMEFIK